jgi:hypothetical protein
MDGIASALEFVLKPFEYGLTVIQGYLDLSDMVLLCAAGFLVVTLFLLTPRH